MNKSTPLVCSGELLALAPGCAAVTGKPAAGLDGTASVTGKLGTAFGGAAVALLDAARSTEAPAPNVAASNPAAAPAELAAGSAGQMDKVGLTAGCGWVWAKPQPASNANQARLGKMNFICRMCGICQRNLLCQSDDYHTGTALPTFGSAIHAGILRPAKAPAQEQFRKKFEPPSQNFAMGFRFSVFEICWSRGGKNENSDLVRGRIVGGPA